MLHRPDGEVDFRVTVPKYPLTWVIHGVSMSRNLGLGIQPSPIQVCCFQPFYERFPSIFTSPHFTSPRRKPKNIQ